MRGQMPAVQQPSADRRMIGAQRFALRGLDALVVGLCRAKLRIDLRRDLVECQHADVLQQPGKQRALRLVEDGGDRFAPGPAISEWNRRTDQRAEGKNIVDAFSIIVDEYKLIRNVERPEGVPEFELYHHYEDPLDLNDIASEHPEIVERLAEQLENWHTWALANKLPTDAEATEGLDSEELERLRSLGYVQ